MRSVFLKVHGHLLRIYPPWFRDRFGEDLSQSFSDSLDYHRARGLMSLLLAGLAGWVDVIVEATKERFDATSLKAWRSSMIASTVFDIRTAARSLLRTPRFLFASTVVLVLGIGLASTIFSVVNGVLFRPLPYGQPEELYQVKLQTDNSRTISFPGPLLTQVIEPADLMGSLAASTVWRPVLTGVGDPKELDAFKVNESYFLTLNGTPSLGRLLVPSDAGSHVVVLSNSLWNNRFGGDESIVGKTVALDGQPYEVVGVSEPDFADPETPYSRPADMWVPIDPNDPVMSQPRQFSFTVIARLPQGVEPEIVEAGLDSRFQDFDRAGSMMAPESEFVLDPLKQSIVGGYRSSVGVLFGAVGLLLFLSCLNVGTLFLARGVENQRELTVRLALGSGWSRVARYLLTESALVALFGCLGGVLLAFWGVEAFKALGGLGLPRLDELQLDLTVLGFSVAASALTAIVCGMLPALRISSVRVSEELRSVNATAARSDSGLRSFLVGGEVAVSVVLLIGSMLLFRSLMAIRFNEPGYDGAGIVAVPLALSNQYNTHEQRMTFARNLTERLEALPGVTRVSYGSSLPIGRVFWMSSISRPETEGSEFGHIHNAGPGYFTLLGVPMVEGRDLQPEDAENGDEVPVIVNRLLADWMWPGESAVGQTLEGNFLRDAVGRVVGVIDTLRFTGLDQEVTQQVYLPIEARSFHGYMTFGMSYQGDLAALAPALREAVWDIDPTLPVPEVDWLDRRLSTTTATPRVYAIIMSLFAGISLVITLCGVYASAACSSLSRVKEFGVRMALGAQASALLRQALVRSSRVTVLGMSVGVIASLLLGRFVEAQLYQTSPTDNVTYAGVVVAILLSGILATYLPARSVLRSDPMKALRQAE